jgi:hypothetical protein
MKNYLALAIVLGAIAFVSVSYLAQAQPKTGAVTTAVETATEAPAAPAADVVDAATGTEAPVADMYAKDKEECTTMSSAATTEGAEMSAEATEAAFKKCMMDKGHTEAEITAKADEEAKAAEEKADETPAAETAPAAETKE